MKLGVFQCANRDPYLVEEAGSELILGIQDQCPLEVESSLAELIGVIVQRSI
jgi:hypothetical protein